MSIPAGQAARDGALKAATGAGRVAHRLMQVMLALLIVICIAVGALAIRLAQGPLDVAWLARRITQNVTLGSDVTFGRATIAWQGLHRGIDSTVDLALDDVRITTTDGEHLVQVPHATASLGAGALLRGRLAPHDVMLQGVQVALRRSASGAVMLDIGPQAVTEAAPSKTHSMLAQLNRVQITDSTINVDDQQLGVPWSVRDLTVDLNRAGVDAAHGTAHAAIAMGGETLTVDARLALLPQAGGMTIAASISPFVPARLAMLAPALAPLAALDAPLHLSADMALDDTAAFRGATIKASVEAGMVHAGDGTVPIRAATISADITQAHLDLRLEPLLLQPRDEAPLTTVTAHVTASRANGKVDAHAVVDIDQVAFSDLSVLWPAGVGGPGTRPWIIENLTAGLAKGGHAEVTLTAPEDFSDATVTRLVGGMDGVDVTGHWLRPVPPIEHGMAKVVFVDPDTMDIIISEGRQAGTQLTLRPSRVRLTGLAGHDQFIAITGDMGGPLADLLTLLRQPRIRMLDRRPMDLREPRGAVVGQLTVNFPLKTDLDMDVVAIHAVGKLTDGHLTGIAVGRDIDRAMLAFDVSNDGLKITGPAEVAKIPAQLKVHMDFRPGGPTQVMQRVSLAATVTPKQLTSAGLDTAGVMSGAIGVQLDYLDRRDSTGDVRITADITGAGVDGGRLPWRKTAGSAGIVEAHVLLKGGKISGIDRVRAEAPGLSILADADTTGSNPKTVRLQRLIIGETTNVTGELRFPDRIGQPYVGTISGPSLDLSREFDRKAEASAKKPADTSGPVFRLDARLDRVLLAHDKSFSNVTAHVENNGDLTTSARLSASVGGAALNMSITPAPGGRRLVADAQDAGAMLRALDIIQSMAGGQLRVTGGYDDTTPAHALRGTAQISDFRIRNAPSIGRILQAMSLYGLVELVQGPGLGFTSMVAPFEMQNEVLTLNDARAYSASLGITAKGRIDLARSTADMEGTVIPAYFFNSLLGRVPVLGRLFAPEKGGGVFAATYSVRGPLEDPSVSVNPLAALTPGFLRGFFDIFDSNTPPAATTPTFKEPQR